LIPTTLLGLLFLAAGLGPGFVYLRVTERRQVSPDRSQLLEAAELVVVGGMTSLISTFLLVVICQQFDLLDFAKIHHDAANYLANEPVRCLGFLLAVLLISYFIAWAAAHVPARETADTIRPGAAPWNVVMEEDRKSRAVLTTVELKNGFSVTGSLRSYSSGGNAPWPVIALVAPLTVTDKNGAAFPLTEDFYLAEAEDVRAISGRYEDGVPFQPAK
jgi:hypothetical protein